MLDEGYRPGQNCGLTALLCKHGHEKRQRRHDEDAQKLHQYKDAHDEPEYIDILKKVLEILGKSIHVSLERSMVVYLESCGGSQANSKLGDLEKNLIRKLRCENDNAERCFATLREMHKRYPSMSLHK